jgi:zinc protease
VKDGFTQKELDDTKKGILQNNKIDRAKDDRLVGIITSNLDINRNMQWDKNIEQAVQELSLLQVNMAVKKYLKATNFSIIKAGDSSKFTD